jgi:toxin YoeB
VAFRIAYTKQAQEDFRRLGKENPKLKSKVVELLASIEVSPSTGIGRPKRLTGNLSGFWSRRIDAKHRLVYVIEEDVVRILSAYGHYEDK